MIIGRWPAQEVWLSPTGRIGVGGRVSDGSGQPIGVVKLYNS